MTVDGHQGYSQVDRLGVRYKSFNFGAETRPGLAKLVSPNRVRQSWNWFDLGWSNGFDLEFEAVPKRARI